VITSPATSVSRKSRPAKGYISEPSTEFGDAYLKLTKELATGLRDR
jgi:hypothetical protein